MFKHSLQCSIIFSFFSITSSNKSAGQHAKALLNKKHFQCLDQRNTNVLLKTVQRLFLHSSTGQYGLFPILGSAGGEAEKGYITFFQGLFTIVLKVCMLLPDHNLRRALSQLIVHTFQCRNWTQLLKIPLTLS